MSRKEQRILRVMMEGMTAGLPAGEKEATWKRMLEGYQPARQSEVMKDEAKMYAVLEEIEVGKKEFHQEVLRCCEHGLNHEPSADYPEMTKDAAHMETMDFESWLSTEELMELGQRAIIRNIRKMRDSEALRERLAKRCAIKLV